MFKIKENDLFSKNMSGSELYKTTKLSKDNSKKLVTDYDKESFDKWMKDLIDQNGVTKYQNKINNMAKKLENRWAEVIMVILITIIMIVK